MKKSKKVLLAALAATTALGVTALAAPVEDTDLDALLLNLVGKDAATINDAGDGIKIGIGQGANAGGEKAISIGYKATSSQESSIAIGSESSAVKDEVIAIGANSRAGGDNSMAIGAGATANAINSIVMGKEAVVADDAEGAMALGVAADVKVAGGIALGFKSVADREAGVLGYLQPAGDNSSTWMSTRSALSIGNAEEDLTRQITGVAAGSEDTDAVNVAQLKVIETELDEVAAVADSAIQSFKVGDGIVDEFFTVDKEENRFDIMGVEGSGVVTSIDGQKVMIGLDGRGVIDTINAVDNAKVTNIQAFFTLKDSTGADTGIELNDGDVPELLFVGEEDMLDVEVDGMGTGARVTVKTNANLGKNLDISENESILSLNEAVNNLGPWKLRANNGDERLIGKDDIVNFVDGEMTTVAIEDEKVIVDLNDDTKTRINKIDGIEADVANLDDRVTTEVGRLDGRIDAVDERLTTEVERLDGEVERLDGEVERLDGEVERLDGEVERLDGEVERLDGEVERLDGEVVRVEQKFDGEVERLDGEVERLDGEVVRVEQKFDGEVERLDGEVVRLDEKIDANKVSVLAGDNIEVTANETETEYTVALAKDINVTSVTADKVTAGTVQANAYQVGDVVYIDENGINANNKVISNVAAGVAPTDAANMAQLQQVSDHVAHLGRDVNDLRDESREGDAMGMALAALKPLQYDPYNRSQILAGVGGYRGQHAVALGLAHYTNEDTMLHAGLAYAGDSHMAYNVGVSWRFGSNDERLDRVPERYAEGPISSIYVMQEEMDRVIQENEAQREIIEELQRRLEALEAKQ